MKSYVLIAFLIHAFMLSGSGASRSDLYEDLLANSFLILSDLGKSDLSQQKKVDFVRAGAHQAFVYWMRTRKGNVEKSTSVDTTVKIFYSEICKINKEVVFNDPLGRKHLDDPESLNLSHLPKITQKQYLIYVSEFITFLKSPRENRKNTAEQGAAANP